MAGRPPRLASALLLLLACLTVFPESTRTADGPRFTLAVLRRDGTLIPFARFDGRGWSNRWPVEQAVNVPIALADVPKGWWPNDTVTVDWTAWPLSGAARPIKVLAPTVVKIHCWRRVVLRTDFVPADPVPPPQVQPFPKSGLAVAGDVAIERVEVLPTTGPEADAIVESLKQGVLDAENKSVRMWSALWQHPVDEKGRAKTPLTLEVLSRTPGLEPGSSVYYFEGVKTYPGFPQASRRIPPSASASALMDMCDYLTYAGGWTIMSPKQPVKASVGAELSNCNREGLAYTLPLGAIRVAGRLFWVVQVSSWDFERYDVVELKTGGVKVVLSVGAGACRPDQ